MAKGIDSAS